MLEKLPFEIVTFATWYLIGFPRKLWRTTFRMIALLNNEVSFTLNLKLLFTPLYGDYTRIGRLIGFVIRILEIFFGLFMMLIMTVLAIILPIVWVFLPMILAYYTHILIMVPYLLLIFVLKVYFHRDVPSKRVSEVTDTEAEASYRPHIKSIYEQLVHDAALTSDFLKHPAIDTLLMRLELNRPDFKEKVTSVPIDLSKFEITALNYAKKHETRYIEHEHLFLAALSLIAKVDLLLATFDSSLDECDRAVDWVVSERELQSKKHVWQDDFVVPKMSGVGKGMTGHVTPFLDSVSRDFTKMAQHYQFRPVLGHKAIIKEVTELISGSTVNVLLVGPPGCGKTSVVQGIAESIVKGTDVNAIRFKRIVAIDTASLLAGTRFSGDIAEKIKKLMEESKSSKDIILFFDEIHNLVSGATTEEGSTIFSLLEPHLVDSKIQFIGATNQENFRKYIEPNGSFARLFQKIEVPATSDEETLLILEDVAREKEREYGVIVSFPALAEILKLSKKLIHDRVFPDKALDILERTIAQFRDKNKYITANNIKEEISVVTHIPVTTLSEDESKKLLSIETKLKERVIGQDHAITQLAKALQRARAGIRDESKPIASFLFVGTTGVGKTETAKALSAEYFGDEKAMIRLDMSEYQQPDSLSRLLGEPNGKTKGVLTEAVRTKPFALILLDEIEKAYSTILLAFLQVLDDGRLTDSSGTTVDFTNTIIIATSNVGTKDIQEIVAKGGTQDEMSDVALRAVREHYAPEFLNRFTGLIVYNPLTKEDVKKIADLMLNKVRKVAQEKNIKLSFTPELLDALVEKGFNKEWGARSMSRIIEENVESYLAVKLLEGKVKPGDEFIIGIEVFQ